MSNTIIKIFLASSSELKSDREQFEIFIYQQTKQYIKENIFLELVIWEDFIDVMSMTRLQDEYNKAIAECDIFVSLFHTKVGQYTEEEFTHAFESFKANQRPLIYTFFKDEPISMSQITPTIQSLLDFRKRLDDLGHFYTIYKNIDDLKFRFSEQLRKILPKLMPISDLEPTPVITPQEKIVEVDSQKTSKLTADSTSQKKELTLSQRLKKERLEERLSLLTKNYQDLTKAYDREQSPIRRNQLQLDIDETLAEIESIEKDIKVIENA